VEAPIDYQRDRNENDMHQRLFPLILQGQARKQRESALGSPQLDQDTSRHVLLESVTQRIVGQLGLQLLAPDPSVALL
jgi:hypothetical protein